jgi:hypothetical protein
MLIPEDKLNRFFNSHVLIVGVGGVGGACFEALVRMGIMNISIVDNDVFSESNLNRQLLCNINNIGNSKAKEASLRAKSINTSICVNSYEMFLNEANIDDLEYSRFLLIADRGICQYANLLHVLDAGNGYIVSKSILKSKKSEQSWIYNDEDYIVKSPDFKYKSKVTKRKVTDEYGGSRTIEEKVVVYWSKRFYERCRRENERFLNFMERLENAPENFRITALQAKSLRKFFKNDCVNLETGEAIPATKLKAMIDHDKIAEFKKHMGYYQIVTSELTMDPLEVIEKYHGLTQIEDQFRAMKGELETRPIYVHTPEHIEAHLLICMIALVMMRIIQKRIITSGLIIPNEDSYWSTGLNGKRIQQALCKWKVDALPGDLYRFMDVDDPDLKLIIDAFEINIPAKLYRRAELKSLKKDIKIFK